MSGTPAKYLAVSVPAGREGRKANGGSLTSAPKCLIGPLAGVAALSAPCRPSGGPWLFPGLLWSAVRLQGPTCDALGATLGETNCIPM